MNFKIETIPHVAQRYDTVGDFFYRHMNEIFIRVSDFSGAVARSSSFELKESEVHQAERLEFCVMIHELVESFLCHQAHIQFEDIDQFDLTHAAEDDPGSNLEAPYHEQHMLATEVEKLVAKILNVSWEEYGKAVNIICAKHEEQEIHEA